MSEQQTAVAEAEVIPTTPVENADAGTDSNSAPETVEATETQPKENKTPDWLQRKIDKKTAQQRAAERERDAYRAELERLKASLNAETPAQQPTPHTQIDPMALAETLKRQIRSEEASNRTFEAGIKEFPDFEAACSTVGQHFQEELAARPDFFEVLNDLPDAHKVYYSLAKNPEELARILDQSPAKMALALAKKSAEISAPKSKPISNAPKPTTPIGGSAKVGNEYRPDMSMQEYQAWRKTQSNSG